MLNTSTVTAFRVGFETLRTNPLRTGLAALGVVIGVGALVAVMAVGDGMERFGLESIRNEGFQSVVVQPLDATKVDDVWIAREDVVRFGVADAAALERAAPAGSIVSMTVQGAALVTVPGADRPRGAMLHGVLPPPEGTRSKIAHGRDISAADARTGAEVVLLSHALAAQLAAPDSASAIVGRNVRFSTGAERRVVGVIEPAKGPGAAANVVVAPFASAEALMVFTRRAPSATIEVRAARVEDVRATQQAVERWAASRWPDWKDAIRIQAGASEQRIEQLRRGVLGFKLFMGAIVGISLVVGGIGIMNVLLASVTERTREIGIRKTTGARRSDIMQQFLAESIVVTGAGAAVGVVLGLVVSFGLTALIRSVAELPVHAAITARTLLLAAGVSVAVGLIFGTYPARRAARLSPIDAIRHE
jgi:putative ABC transport system permease protein